VGSPAYSVDEAVAASHKLGGKVWVVKAQIHAGGRGKGGGVKLAKSVDEVKQYAGQILGMMLKTHQTGPQGQKVRRLLIEEGADIKKELYVAMVVDRGTQRVCLMASSEGGMDIEEVAAKTPEKIHKDIHRPRHRAEGQRVRRGRTQNRHTRGCGREGAAGAARAVQGVRRHRCVARRDQPADTHRQLAT
jgi:succinyl-CoA synthetase beta subunit